MTKQIAILGAGESGVGAAMLAQQQGYTVFVSDFASIKEKYKRELEDLSIEWEEQQHTENRILQAELIIKSPGIPEGANIIQHARKKGISIISEIEFASRYTKGELIAITGTNGKTTTASLTYHIFNKAGKKVALSGNIGDSFARQVATEDKEIYVLEISSFQLDDIEKFKPKAAIILNITPDHLDRYNNSVEQYAQAKLKITQNQDETDYFIFCADDELLQREMDKVQINAQQIPFVIKKKVRPRKELGWQTINFKSIQTIKSLPCLYMN